MLRTLAHADLKNKRVFLRVDFNVPTDNDGNVLDDSRIRRVLPTVKHILQIPGTSLVVCTHLGRPKGKVVERLRVNKVAEKFAALLGQPVQKIDEAVGPVAEAAVKNLKPGEILMLENIRFYPEEEENLRPFTRALAALADFYVDDAFACVHRAHSSTVGVARQLPCAAGLLVEQEVKMLHDIFENPDRPVLVIIGGVKLETKIGVVKNFSRVAKNIVVGGALANTFLYAQGVEVGASFCEKDRKKDVWRIQSFAVECNCRIVMPKDAVVAPSADEDEFARVTAVSAIGKEDAVFDFGPQAVGEVLELIAEARTIVWNGPVGLFEKPGFENGTRQIAAAIAKSSAKTIVGGGDTVEAITRFGLPLEKFTWVSTGGGAMLEFLEGKELPGLAVLKGA